MTKCIASSGWSCFFTFSVAWCCLSSPGWGCSFPVLFCWVVLLGPLLLGVVLGGVAFSISSQVVLPSFPSFWWGSLPPPPLNRTTFPHLLKGGGAWFPFSLVLLSPSPLAWCCLPSPPLGGDSFSPLVCWVAQLGFPPLGGPLRATPATADGEGEGQPEAPKEDTKLMGLHAGETACGRHSQSNTCARSSLRTDESPIPVWDGVDRDAASCCQPWRTPPGSNSSGG